MVAGARSDVRPTRKPWQAAAVYAAAVVVVAGVGGLATSAGQGTDGWYAGADKPFFTPPGGCSVGLDGALRGDGGGCLAPVRRREGISGRRAAQALSGCNWPLNFLWTHCSSPASCCGSRSSTSSARRGRHDLVVRAWRVDRVAAWLLAPLPRVDPLRDRAQRRVAALN
jgi:hypothetical protein